MAISKKEITSSGSIVYYHRNGHVHREDGPAYITTKGYVKYCLHGVEYDFDEWIKRTPIPDEDKVLLILEHLNDH